MSDDPTGGAGTVGPGVPSPTGTSRAPAIGAPIRSGTVLQDGTTIGEYIGRSDGALNFYGENPNVGRVVVKILAPQLEEPLTAFADTMTSLYGVQHPALQQLVGRGRIGPRTFLTYEYIDGQTLRSALQQVIDAGGAVDAPTTALFVVNASLALDALHAVAPHGVLTSENLFLQRDGKLKIINIGFANLTLCAFGTTGDQYGNSAYLAPEVRADPWDATEVSDVYSLGILMVGLLTGRHPTRTELPELVRMACARYPALAEPIEACVAEEPVLRLQSMSEFRAAVRRAVPEAGEQSSPAPAEAAEPLDDFLGGVELPDAPKLGSTDTTSNDPERWITNVDGRDFGPYTTVGVHELLTSDEINENTQIVDLFSQESLPLIDMPEFTDFVMEYLPVRAKRNIARSEKRERTVKTAKRTGGLTAVLGTLAAIGVMVIIYLTQVESPPVPIAEMVQVYPHEFVLQEPTFVEIQADEELIASLFDFSDPPPEEPASSGRGVRSGRSGGDSEPESEEEAPPSLEDYVVSFDNSRPSRKLSNDEINATIASNQSSIQRCFQRELRANPEFEGVTVRWSIIPDGRTTDIRVEEHGEVTDEVKACLRRAFRHMRFPEFNDVPMTISIPFRLQ